ncbi:MAG: MerR family transcriptional regulator, partial [Planctomycetota bacterium]|nr:MerR family transcriptional regulator [Planctomycetota bacterium]
MTPSDPLIGPSEAAKQLGVSVKALRLYEQRGLISPLRTAAGWRVYGTEEMMRAAEIVALRGLGLSLRQVERVLTGSAADLAPSLAMHQTLLEGRIHELSDTVEKVRRLRTDCAAGKPPLAEL